MGTFTREVAKPAGQTKSLKVVKNNQTSSTSLTPVANKGIGNLIPVNTKFAMLQEDLNNSGSGDDTLSDKSVALDDTDYGAHANPTQKERMDNLKNDDISSLNSARSTSSLKRDDLKQALLSIMEKKDELEDQVKAVKKLLDQEINHVAETKQELNDMKQK